MPKKQIHEEPRVTNAAQRAPRRVQAPLHSRFAGLFLTLAVIVALEALAFQHISVVAPAAVLLLAVAFSANRGGPVVGLISAGMAGLYVLHAMLAQHGLGEGGPPLVYGTVLGIALVAVAVLVGRLHQRLEHVTETAREDRTQSERRLAGALEDVARAQTEVRLQATLLDAVGQAVLATDRSGRLLYANRAAAALYALGGAQRSALITDVAPVPDPLTGVDETVIRVRRGESWSGESSAPTPGGGDMPVLVTDSPFHDDDGRPAGMVRVVTDLSLRRKAEETQRLLADAGAVLAGSLDYTSTLRALSRIVVPALADCCIVDVLGEDGRPERTEISHVNPAQELLAREMRERYPIDPDSPDHPTAQVLRTGRPRLFTTVPEETVRRIAFDKEHLARMRELNYRSVMVVPLRASGRTLGSLSFFIAGSNRRYGEEDLALAEDLARRAATAIEHARLYEQALLANQAKADFLAVMSHELRTPLTTVMGYADLLLGGLPEPIGDRAHVYVERLRGAAAHLLGLIDQILVYARLDLGRAELHPERALVGDLLRDAAALIEPVAAERGIAFHVDPPEPHTIETDITKLRQILLNLLANAVKFTDEGEVRMCARREGREIVFEVRDTGIGIEPDQMDRVFDPFWQVDQSATRRVGGTGLGLSVSRRLARFLGGDVTVASQAGAGTSFFVRLPERWTPPPPAASTASALTTARR